MRTGMFPGQLEALRREVRVIEQEERQKGTRRMFLGAAVGLVSGIAGGFGVGRWAVPAAAATEQQQPAADTAATPEALRQLAVGPLSELTRRRLAFLSGCESLNSFDADICYGLQRLAHIADEEQVAKHELLRRYLLQLAKSRSLPPSLAPAIRRLESKGK